MNLHWISFCLVRFCFVGSLTLYFSSSVDGITFSSSSRCCLLDVHRSIFFFFSQFDSFHRHSFRSSSLRFEKKKLHFLSLASVSLVSIESSVNSSFLFSIGKSAKKKRFVPMKSNSRFGVLVDLWWSLPRGIDYPEWKFSINEDIWSVLSDEILHLFLQRFLLRSTYRFALRQTDRHRESLSTSWLLWHRETCVFNDYLCMAGKNQRHVLANIVVRSISCLFTWKIFITNRDNCRNEHSLLALSLLFFSCFFSLRMSSLCVFFFVSHND